MNSMQKPPLTTPVLTVLQPKRPYTTPVLTVHGTLEELTKTEKKFGASDGFTFNGLPIGPVS